MMNPRKLLRFALLTCPLFIAQGTGADEASHHQAVDTLFRLTQMEQKVGESVDNLLALQLRQNPQLVPHEAIVRSFLERHIGWQALQPELVAMYLAAFSEQELTEINAFYITPVGQKVITRVPELVQERNRLAAQRLQENVGELQKELQAASEQR